MSSVFFASKTAWIGAAGHEGEQFTGGLAVFPQVALRLPDLALVAQAVFDDKPGLFLDPGLLPRALGRLVRLVVLAWVSHGLLASFLGLLDTDSHAGPAGRLGALPADFLAGLVPDALVAADLPHHVDVFVAGKRNVATNKVLGLAGVEVFGRFAIHCGMLPEYFSTAARNRLTDSSSMRPSFAYSSTLAIREMTVEECLPTPLMPVSATRTDFVPSRSVVPIRTKYRYFFFLSHPIPSILRLSL